MSPRERHTDRLAEAMIPDYLSPAQVCELLPGVTEKRLEGLRGSGRGPRYFKPTLRTVLYDRDGVIAWVESTKVTTRES